jgi:uncharacterized membrane protein YkvA (DUF1232 family)
MTSRAGASRRTSGDFHEEPASPSRRRKKAPRAGLKRTLLSTISLLPHYLRLLAGLLTDRRVAAMDKLLVLGAITYILMPLDFIPDFVPFMGQVDDIYLLMLALERLITHAGSRVIVSHWHGPLEALSSANLRAVVAAAAFFLPRKLQNRLRRVAR